MLRGPLTCSRGFHGARCLCCRRLRLRQLAAQRPLALLPLAHRLLRDSQLATQARHLALQRRGASQAGRQGTREAEPRTVTREGFPFAACCAPPLTPAHGVLPLSHQLLPLSTPSNYPEGTGACLLLCRAACCRALHAMASHIGLTFPPLNGASPALLLLEARTCSAAAALCAAASWWCSVSAAECASDALSSSASTASRASSPAPAPAAPSLGPCRLSSAKLRLSALCSSFSFRSSS